MANRLLKCGACKIQFWDKEIMPIRYCFKCGARFHPRSSSAYYDKNGITVESFVSTCKNCGYDYWDDTMEAKFCKKCGNVMDSYISEDMA